MNQPTECKWCGHELVDETTNDDLFACGSSRRFFSDTWSQSKGCMEIMENRDRIFATDNRIRRAMDLLYKSTRFHIVHQLIQILEGGDNAAD